VWKNDSKLLIPFGEFDWPNKEIPMITGSGVIN